MMARRMQAKREGLKSGSPKQREPAEFSRSRENDLKGDPMVNADLPQRPQTLLIVDDEEALVELVRRMVERNGYRTLAARSAGEALDLYRAHRDEIDLVITDLVMGDRDGWEVARELREINPDVRILVSTGFHDEDDIGRMLQAGIRGVVLKPYQSQQLLEKVREALDS